VSIPLGQPCKLAPIPHEKRQFAGSKAGNLSLFIAKEMVGGVTNTHLYRTFMTGMDGSPMVSYADKLTPEQTWDLVHYTRTLQVGHKNRENSVLAAAGRNIPVAAQPKTN
jgi:mono/diheme cytochrome c family protein